MARNKYIKSVQNFFKKDGILSENLTNYNFRDIQSQMAIQIAESIKIKSDIIIEAGTGVGKTFAYLVPALLTDKKVIISTGTKTLQDQLFKKDLPVINNLLENPKNVVLLKGRKNYLCKYKLEQALYEDSYESKEIARDIKEIVKWHDETISGDISTIKTVSEKSPTWHKVTASQDNCLNKDCPYFKNCFVMNVKKKALTADVIIVNHHLLLSDWKLIKEDSAFLPKVDIVILDEAHQIPDLAHDYFGEYLSSLAVKDFFKDISSYIKNNSLNILGIENIAHSVDKKVTSIFNILDSNDFSKNNLQVVKRNNEFKQCLIDIKIELEKLKIILDANKDKSKDLENYFNKSVDLYYIVKAFIKYLENNKSDSSKIYWYEVFSKNFNLYITPIDISQEYSKIIKNLKASMVYTSATITTNNNFDYYIKNLGLV